jgi:ABC-2 type transport system permease protein
MTWAVVARKDFQDAVRSRWLWVLSALFVIVFALPPALVFYLEFGSFGAQQAQQQGGSTDAFIFLLKGPTSILVPLIAIVISYASVTRERESGTMKLLMSLPHSRENVVVGKVLGRSAVVALPVAVGFLFALLVLLPTSLTLNLGNFLLFAILTVLLGAVFVGLAVGVSAAADTNRQAVVGSVGLFFLFTFFWNLPVNQIVDRLGFGNEAAIEMTVLLKLVNPTQAYKTLADTLLADSAVAARIQMFGLFRRSAAAEVLGDSLPVYLSDPLALVYLLAWLVLPVAAGILVFRDLDL